MPPRLDHHAFFLISGPSASGKSTVARLLAERFERSVHLEGDCFRRSIVAGRHEMTPDASPEAVRQLRLRYRLATAAADTYFEDRFTVVLEDVIAGPLLPECVGLVESRPVHVVVLVPSVRTLSRRDADRGRTGYAHWPVERLYELFAHETPRLGLWLDTSEQLPAQTVGEILARTLGGPAE